jgi:hypothetical protein
MKEVSNEEEEMLNHELIIFALILIDYNSMNILFSTL